MSTKPKAGNLRPAIRSAPQRKRILKNTRPGKLRSPPAERAILKLVRTGVEEFILKNATVEEFFRTIRAAAKKDYSTQLTRPVFARIVREAVRTRKLRRPR